MSSSPKPRFTLDPHEVIAKPLPAEAAVSSTLQRLLDALPSGLALVDKHGTVLMTNRVWEHDKTSCRVQPGDSLHDASYDDLTGAATRRWFYTQAERALEQMSRSWAAEYGPFGVRVNAITPGVVLTEGNEGSGEIIAQMIAPTPAGRACTPADIAKAVVFLASDDAAFIHAATLTVDGGILNTASR